MQEIAPGLYDWTTFHEGIRSPVHSHLHVPSGTLIDPRVPEGGVAVIGEVTRPARIVLTNRHHLRHAQAFVDAFRCEVLCEERGLHEFAGGAVGVRGFAAGDVLAPGVQSVEVGAITPEEVGLLLDAGPGFLALADILIRPGGGELSFVPDFLLGDDPAAVKLDMHAALVRLLDEQRFDGLLLAHGEPYASGGRDALAAFVAAWTPTS
ncbi:MAG TPA: hypothetical protein VF533_11750 [Solirubrobacteraceae bacterium]|jgi:hypothetical protein